jgi:hypothetical protein
MHPSRLEKDAWILIFAEFCQNAIPQECHIVYRSIPSIFSIHLLHFYSPIFEMAQIGPFSKNGGLVFSVSFVRTLKCQASRIDGVIVVASGK